MVAAKSTPSPEYLRVCFDYTPETGVLRWKTRPREHFKTVRGWNTFNAQFSGKVAGHLNTTLGYLQTNVCKRLYFNHRIVWAAVHGEWPENEIDHINGDKADNRIENLREATRFENNCNRGATKNNKIGFKGVYFDKSRRRFHAMINHTHIGYFDTPELAHAAYCAAADRLHGEFVNHGD